MAGGEGGCAAKSGPCTTFRLRASAGHSRRVNLGWFASCHEEYLPTECPMSVCNVFGSWKLPLYLGQGSAASRGFWVELYGNGQRRSPQHHTTIYHGFSEHFFLNRLDTKSKRQSKGCHVGFELAARSQGRHVAGLPTGTDPSDSAKCQPTLLYLPVLAISLPVHYRAPSVSSVQCSALISHAISSRAHSMCTI